MKPFLILQLRPEAEASDDEFRAILEKGGLAEERVHRVRLEREPNCPQSTFPTMPA
jgi:GMP synthase (glutamine-hydrolysing)